MEKVEVKSEIKDNNKIELTNREKVLFNITALFEDSLKKLEINDFNTTNKLVETNKILKETTVIYKNTKKIWDDKQKAIELEKKKKE